MKVPKHNVRHYRLKEKLKFLKKYLKASFVDFLELTRN